jgi:monoamine oxidase
VPALVVFINGDRAREWSAVDPPIRRSAVLLQLERWFGAEAGQPLEYIEKDWVSDNHTGGCPIASYGADVLTRFGLARQLAEPCWPAAGGGAPSCRLHWAGTESSEIGTGFMDGAVHAGFRAAANVQVAIAQQLSQLQTGIIATHVSTGSSALPVMSSSLEDSFGSRDEPLLVG